MPTPPRLLLSLALALASLLACNPPPSVAATADASTAPGACAHEGDQCPYAEGKIGLCTTKPGCQGGTGCFVCMSLH